VVIESIILVSKLDKTTTSDTNAVVTKVETENVTPTEVISQPVADFVFETTTQEMKVGKSYQVNLTLTGRQNVNLDAMEFYVKYDPSKVTVSKLVANKSLPEMTKVSGIDAKSGLISSVFLWDVGQTYSVKTDESTTVLTFTVTPKMEGSSEISLITGEANQKNVTLLVESSTSKSLTFLKNTLTVSANK
jgi:hypothetical protein